MIYYSIIPLDLVMNGYPGEYAETVELNYNGEKVQAIPLENNRYILTRLISTSPKAYLDPSFQPGKVIKGE